LMRMISPRDFIKLRASLSTSPKVIPMILLLRPEL